MLSRSPFDSIEILTGFNNSGFCVSSVTLEYRPIACCHSLERSTVTVTEIVFSCAEIFELKIENWKMKIANRTTHRPLIATYYIMTIDF